MKTVRQQATKCNDLRGWLVAWINQRPGQWLLGMDIADLVRVELKAHRIRTSGEVLMKELRHAQRLGEIQKRIRKGTRYVEYTSRGPEPRAGGGLPPDPAASCAEVPGELFNNECKVHGQDVGRRR